MIYTGLLSLLLAEYAANQKCSAVLLCSADSIYPLYWQLKVSNRTTGSTSTQILRLYAGVGAGRLYVMGVRSQTVKQLTALLITMEGTPERNWHQ